MRRRFARAGYAPLPVYQEPVESSSSRPDAAQEYPLVLTFFRLVQFCDEQHRNIPRLRRPVPEPFLEIHPSTATALQASGRGMGRAGDGHGESEA